MKFKPKDPDFAVRVRASFEKQSVMTFIGAELTRIEPGEAEIRLPFRSELTQQNGFIHAGIIAAIADSSCGYAALSLMEAGKSVLSVEFKQNLLAPAVGDAFFARAEVIRPGRTLTVVRADVFALSSHGSKLTSTMIATMIGIG